MNSFYAETLDRNRTSVSEIGAASQVKAAFVRAGYALAVLALVLAGVRVVVPPVSTELRIETTATAQSPAVAGSGPWAPASAQALGNLAADLFWLQTHESWVARDLERTQAGLQRTVAANPLALAFWLNGARITAYDMPEWRIDRTGRGIASSATLRRINREQAQEALAWLERAREFHPSAPEIFIEQALIQLYRLHDLAAAAASFKRAAEQPGAPFYAARLQVLLSQRWRLSTAGRG